MVSTLYKNYPKKQTAILLSLDSILSIAKPIVKLHTKQKHVYLAKNITKHTN